MNKCLVMYEIFTKYITLWFVRRLVAIKSYHFVLETFCLEQDVIFLCDEHHGF